MHEKTLPECGSVETWRLTWKGNDVSRSQRSPAKTAKIKEKETQTAVILNVAVQSKVEVDSSQPLKIVKGYCPI